VAVKIQNRREVHNVGNENTSDGKKSRRSPGRNCRRRLEETMHMQRVNFAKQNSHDALLHGGRVSAKDENGQGQNADCAKGKNAGVKKMRRALRNRAAKIDGWSWHMQLVPTRLMTSLAR